jgi:hypothetical protein
MRAMKGASIALGAPSFFMWVMKRPMALGGLLSFLAPGDFWIGAALEVAGMLMQRGKGG